MTVTSTGVPEGGETPMTSLHAPGRRRPRRSWPPAAALLVLSAIPLVAGTMRLVELAGGPALIAADERFAASPLPVVLHIVGAAGYVVAGVLQFAPRFR